MINLKVYEGWWKMIILLSFPSACLSNEFCSYQGRGNDREKGQQNFFRQATLTLISINVNDIDVDWDFNVVHACFQCWSGIIRRRSSLSALSLLMWFDVHGSPLCLWRPMWRPIQLAWYSRFDWFNRSIDVSSLSQALCCMILWYDQLYTKRCCWRSIALSALSFLNCTWHCQSQTHTSWKIVDNTFEQDWQRIQTTIPSWNNNQSFQSLPATYSNIIAISPS